MTVRLTVVDASVGVPHHGSLVIAYEAHLDRSLLLSANTRRSYSSRVRRFLAWLAAQPEPRFEQVLTDAHEARFAARDYERELRVNQRRSPATVNATLGAIDNLYAWRGLPPCGVKRQHLPPLAPRALSVEEVRSLLRAAERAGRPRDTAILTLLLATGIRLAEAAALDVDDVAISARKGLVTVRDGKGAAYREVPLNVQGRDAMRTWLAVRPVTGDPASFLATHGGRMTTRAIDLVVRGLGHRAGLQISPHVLRHTAATRLIRGGVDVVLVSALLGHRSLQTTARYAQPSQDDLARAVDNLVVDA